MGCTLLVIDVLITGLQDSTCMHAQLALNRPVSLSLQSMLDQPSELSPREEHQQETAASCIIIVPARLPGCSQSIHAAAETCDKVWASRDSKLGPRSPFALLGIRNWLQWRRHSDLVPAQLSANFCCLKQLTPFETLCSLGGTLVLIAEQV